MAKNKANQSRPQSAGTPAKTTGDPRSISEGHLTELRRSPELILALLLLGSVLAAFLPAITNDFVRYDDRDYVTDNLHVRQGLTWASFSWAFRTTTASNWHPLTWLSHMLDCQLFGLRPWGHHLDSVLLHSANAVFLFLLLRKLTRALWRSLFVAALFGLHPLHVESVAWVAERKDVLSTLLLLLCLWAYAKYVHCAESRKHANPGCRVGARELIVPRTVVYYLAALFLFTLGLMAKPMLVSVPFILLLLDFWPLGRFAPLSGFRRLLLEKVPFVVVSAASSLVTLFAQQAGGATAMLAHLSLNARVQNALVSYARYLLKAVWPSHLAFFYPHPYAWPAGTVALAAVLLSAISAAVVFSRKGRPFLLVGWLWFVVALIPVSGLVQVGRQAMADHYTYIPLIGLFLLFVWGIHALTSSWRRQAEVLAGAAVVMLGLCGAVTFRQTGHWKNSEALFRHALAVTDNNYLACANLACELADQGQVQQAVARFQQALEMKPDEVNTRNNFGSLLLNVGRVEEAREQFSEAVKWQPGFAAGHNNLGYALQRLGRLEEARSEYQQALRLAPNDFQVRLNLATILVRLGADDQAASQLEAALKLRPNDASIRNKLGYLLFRSGRVDDALLQFESALQLDPQCAEARTNLQTALMAKRRAAGE